MDPNATLTEFLNALRAKDREACYGPLENLTDWIASGGFLPNDPRRPASETILLRHLYIALGAATMANDEEVISQLKPIIFRYLEKNGERGIT
jgi:hypothetical protein